MARITVEDCLERVDNRFELVLLATKRARQIARGSEPLVDELNDKSTVIALREIADGHITAASMAEREARDRVTAELLEELGGDGDMADPMA